jgi:hypothetical protein
MNRAATLTTAYELTAGALPAAGQAVELETDFGIVARGITLAHSTTRLPGRPVSSVAIVLLDSGVTATCTGLAPVGQRGWRVIGRSH